MKTKVKKMSYEEVLAIKVAPHKRPLKISMFFRVLLKVLSRVVLTTMGFEVNKINMEKLDKKEPCLVLMNHSSFADLEIVADLMFPRPFNIVTTTDGFVGLNPLMRLIGCIPTKKFVTDLVLVRDMAYTVRELKSSVVLFPEASYSFDGTATTLPESLGKCLKMLKVPVVMIHTYGAFSRQPLYNGLRKRKVKVTADMEYILSPEDIVEKSVDELNEILAQQFSFDNFRWQQENKVSIPNDDRADDLNRVLYKCPHCLTEGKMVGKGITVTCESCGKAYELTEFGALCAVDGEGKFNHIPDWYRWERECVRQELLDGTYKLDVPVDICMMVDTKCVYQVGEGRLVHDTSGFHLTGCEGKLDYYQKPQASYSLYSDYYWYELGDMVCIGNMDVLYYCFPKEGGDVVAKTRLAAEELYKLVKNGEIKA